MTHPHLFLRRTIGGTFPRLTNGNNAEGRKIDPSTGRPRWGFYLALELAPAASQCSPPSAVGSPQRSKIKLVGYAVLNLRPKLLKIKYALVVHLGPKTHLPLRAVPLIFLGNFLNAKRFGSCSGLRQSGRNEGKKEHNECRQCCPQC
jgi:hypothetical protein